MDKNTLSNYGWIVICVLVLAVMMALATPFGTYVRAGVESTTQGLFDTSESALNVVGMSAIGIDDTLENTGVVPDGGIYTIKTTGEILTGGDTLPSVMADGDTFKHNNILYTLVVETTGGTFTSEDELYQAREQFKAEIQNDTGMTWSEFLEYAAANGGPTSEAEMWEMAELTMAETSTYWIATMPNTMTLSTAYNNVLGYSVNEVIQLDFVPEGATYTVKTTGETLVAGDLMPVPATGDRFICGDYEYRYNYVYSSENLWKIKGIYGWGVKFVGKTSTPGAILETINGKPIKCMDYAFYHCLVVTDASNVTIPSGVTSMYNTFEHCSNLTVAPTIPDNVTYLCATFSHCSKLTETPIIEKGETLNMTSTFSNCSSLTTIQVIPDSIKDMTDAFSGCIALTTVPTIPSSVTRMFRTFSGCKSLSGTITINATIIDTPSNSQNYTYCFENTVENIILVGSDLETLNNLASTANNGNVTVG